MPKTTNVQLRPDRADREPGVYYIHGGGTKPQSPFDGYHRDWRRLIAAHGEAAPEISPETAASITQPCREV